MAYFISAAAREKSGSTAYYEFQKGAFRRRFWQPDSLYLPASRFSESELPALLGSVLPAFSPYGVTRVTKKQWAALLAAAAETDDGTRALLSELRPWVDACFTRHRVFHILGL